jgi:hypothetical protein
MNHGWILLQHDDLLMPFRDDPICTSVKADTG